MGFRSLFVTCTNSHRDLYESIEKNEFPRWTMFIQVMPEREASTYRVNHFDLTKVWSKKDYPRIEVGVVELNQNVDNFFAETEQSAFNPANVVPGIGFSPDKMLQGRLFSYVDAQRYRLGVNHGHIPINAPRCPVHSYHRDGMMRVDGNSAGATPHEPDTRGEWVEQPDFREPPLSLRGAADHWNHRVDDDYFSQPGDLFRLMSSTQQQVLFDNTARAMYGTTIAVQNLHIEHCTRADAAYGAGLSDALKRFAEPD